MTVNRYSYLFDYREPNIVLLMSETLQSRLLSARTERGASQTDVAKAAGIRQPTYSELESTPGKGSQHIAKIAHYLGVRAFWLDTGQGPRYESDFFLDDREIELIRMWRKFPTESRGLIFTQFQAVAGSLEDPNQSDPPPGA